MSCEPDCSALRGELRFYFVQVVEEAKKMLDVRNRQDCKHAVVYTYEGHATLVSLVSYIGSDQDPDPGRVYIRHIRHIEDQMVRLDGPHFGLKFGYRGENKRTVQTENMRSALRIRHVFDDE